MTSAFERLSQRIAQAAKRVGRDPGSVQLVAVSKGVGPAALHEAVSAGVCIFGENRVQEAIQKFSDERLDSFRKIQPALSLHLIGSLQSNKVRKAVGFFDLIHSVDSVALAEAIASEAARQSKVQPILVQVNISGEKTKRGLPLQEAHALIERIRQMPQLCFSGLMTIPPHAFSPEASRPYFAMLREWGAKQGISQFSMGMSNDFEVAIEEGATWIRVGTALFGGGQPPFWHSSRWSL